MAIASGSYFGDITGKIGGAVARKSKGQQIVQSYQPNVSNPQTAAQTTQRTRLGEASKMASKISGFLLTYYRSAIQKETPRNSWVRTILKAMAAGNPTPTLAATAQVLYTRGTLSDNGMTVGAITYAANALTGALTWLASPLVGSDAGTDTLSIMVLNQTAGTYNVINTATLRSAGTHTLNITGLNGTDAFTFVFFFRNTALTQNSTSPNRARVIAGAAVAMNASSTGPWG